MKHKLLLALGLIVLLVCAVFASVPAEAFISTSGPYYATPSWDQTMGSYRFFVLTNMNSEAVLDRETGLVWELSPSASRVAWQIAQEHCNQLTTGNRMGWRLPTVQELASLIDPSLAVFPPTPNSPIPLPIDNPFVSIQKFFYWSATTYSDIQCGPNAAWVVGLDDGRAVCAVKTGTGNVWCVRGGQGVNPQ